MAQKGSTSPAPAPVVEDPSKHWARHGPVLTACVVGLNLLMVLLVFFYFWRFFSGKRGPLSSTAGADEESSSADTSPAASPRASWRLRGWPAGRQQEEDIASSLSVSVYSASEEDAAGQAGKAAECAVCIVEFRDGDRARLLPRCGHRFHADCVGAWLQLHSTCPLCRASVLPPAAAAASSELSKNDLKDAAAAADDEECPV